MSFHGVDVDRLNQLATACASLVDALERAEVAAARLTAEIGSAWIGADAHDMASHWRQVDSAALAEVSRLFESATAQLALRAEAAAPRDSSQLFSATHRSDSLGVRLHEFAALQDHHLNEADRLESFVAIQNRVTPGSAKARQAGEKVLVLA